MNCKQLENLPTKNKNGSTATQKIQNRQNKQFKKKYRDTFKKVDDFNCKPQRHKGSYVS